MAGPKARRATALKAAKVERDRRAGVGQGPAQSPSPPPLLQQARHSRRRRVNIIGEDENEKKEAEEETQRARKWERAQAEIAH